jgi:hypothetical protein
MAILNGALAFYWPLHPALASVIVSHKRHRVGTVGITSWRPLDLAGGRLCLRLYLKQDGAFREWAIAEAPPPCSASRGLG